VNQAPTDSEEEFKAVVNDFYDVLYRFAHRLTKNSHDACDLVQQTFIVFANKKGSIKKKSSTKSWLFMTLYREFLSLIKLKNKNTLLVDQGKVGMHSQENDTYRESESEVLFVAMDSLAEHERAILTLFYLNNHSYREISETLDIPIGTVMSRLSRAKDALRLKVEHFSRLHQEKIVAYSEVEWRKQTS
jgi:RNA polymerase sigma-70 factor (ECF subfamily)